MASRPDAPRRAFRIVSTKYPPFDGSGAHRWGSRWISPGRWVVHAADSYALAVLENLAILLAKSTTRSYRYAMHRRNPSFLRALVLVLLAIGPLQAQVVFACAMMDTVMHDECCCDDSQADSGCPDSKCDSTFDSGQDPCCERSVEINVDQEASQTTTPVKPADQRSDVDPPHPSFLSTDALFPAVPPPAPRDYSSSRAGNPPGADTYLVTLRLRI